MDRSVIWTGEVPRDYDLLKGWTRAALDAGDIQLALIGGTLHDVFSALISSGAQHLGNLPGFAEDAGSAAVGTGVTASSPSPARMAVLSGFQVQALPQSGSGTLQFKVDRGSVLAGTVIDNLGNILNFAGTGTVYADLPNTSPPGAPDIRQTVINCPALSQVFANSDADDSSGAARIAVPGSGWNYYVVFVVPTQTDMADADDPNLSGSLAVLPYFNSANPSVPWSGPNNTGSAQASVREAAATVMISVAYNSSNGPTALSSGDKTSILGLYQTSYKFTGLPMFLLAIPSGATQWALATNSSEAGYFVWGFGGFVGASPVAWPLTDSTNPIAPFLRGVTHQHHLGVQGSAPKIDGGAEWAPQSAVYNDTTGAGGTPQSFVNARDIQLSRGLIAGGLNLPSGATAPTPPTINTATNVATPTVSGFTNGVYNNSSETAGQFCIDFVSTAAVNAGTIVTVINGSGRQPVAVMLFPMNAEAAAMQAAQKFYTTQVSDGWAIGIQTAVSSGDGNTQIWGYIALY